MKKQNKTEKQDSSVIPSFISERNKVHIVTYK